MMRFMTARMFRKFTLALSAVAFVAGVELRSPALAGDPQERMPTKPETTAPISWRTTEPNSGDVRPIQGSPSQTIPTTTPKLSSESLPSYLKEMGYEPKVEKMEAGGNLCTVMIRRGTWEAPVKISVSPSGKYVWMVLIVKSNLPDYETIPPRKLARLLESNTDIGPMHFAILPGSSVLTFNYPMLNRTMAREDFRAEIEAFVDKAISTQSLWDGK